MDCNFADKVGSIRTGVASTDMFCDVFFGGFWQTTKAVAGESMLSVDINRHPCYFSHRTVYLVEGILSLCVGVAY